MRTRSKSKGVPQDVICDPPSVAIKLDAADDAVSAVEVAVKETVDLLGVEKLDPKLAGVGIGDERREGLAVHDKRMRHRGL
jgi:hypothetical protein